MIALVLVLTSLFLVLFIKVNNKPVFEEKLSNGAATGEHFWEYVLDQYGLPLGQFCIATMYNVYLNFTIINAVVFFIKYLPTVYCMYKFIKNVYVTSRERLRKKEMELEDIQLQIQIMNTKLCVREAECADRAAALRREAARLRAARARVREARGIDELACWPEADRLANMDDPDFAELLKDLKYDRVALTEKQNDMFECGEHPQFESPEHSIYSSLSETEMNKDCRVKIVKVTNVYKVAYLKHYIKQKRLRRANKQALLKKKMESIKKLLEDWQKSLNLVINHKLSLLGSRAEDTSEQAMGDHGAPHDSDSDSDLRNSMDTCYEEYNHNWTQPSYRNFYEEPETAMTRDFYEPQEYGDNYAPQCECSGPKGAHVLFLLPRLPEETSSQVAVEEIRDDNDTQDGFITV